MMGVELGRLRVNGGSGIPPNLSGASVPVGNGAGAKILLFGGAAASGAPIPTGPAVVVAVIVLVAVTVAVSV
jgi:hypothetical protein